MPLLCKWHNKGFIGLRFTSKITKTSYTNAEKRRELKFMENKRPYIFNFRKSFPPAFLVLMAAHELHRIRKCDLD